MKRQTLNRREYIVLGSLLFGLFFGAGNLIFPIHLGQLAGSNWAPATIGFILSAILLPLLSILAISQTNSASMYDLAKPVGTWFASFFLIATHASLGLLIASPRTATVTFEIGVVPFIPKGTERISLLIFSFLFFLTTFLLSRNEQKITFYVGRLLNPLFLVLLTFIFVWALLIKGDASAVHFNFGHAASTNLIDGFLQGYNTMDALAGLTFGVTITSALKFFKLHDRTEQSKAIAKIGLLSLSVEAIVYALLIMLGAISLNFAKLSANGGTAFSQIMSHYTGIVGTALLAALTLLACLTTAIGLITSLSQDIHRRFPKLSFSRILLITTTGAFLIANLGLDQIIAYSTPILLFLYPLAIALIILGICDPWIKQRPIIYRSTIIATAIPAVLDFVHGLPPFFAHMAIFKAINDFATNTIPWFSIGLDFIPFMLAGLLLGIFLQLLRREKPSASSI